MIPRRQWPVLLLVISLWSVGLPADAQPQAGEDSLSEQEKQQLREAGKKNPAETEGIIKKLDEERRKAWKYKSNPEGIDRDLRDLIENMQRTNSSGSRKEFAEARTAFQNKVRWLEDQKVRIPMETSNKIAEALLDIYEKRAAYTAAPDYLPMEFCAKHASSRRVRAYLLGKLQTGPSDERTFALTTLAWSQSFGGDAEMFGALENLYKAEGQKSPLILGVMSRLDRKKTLPYVLRQIETTNDISLFTKAQDTLSEYGRVDLLDHALKRVKDFPRASWTSEKNPTLGIYPELLLKYVQQAEGDRLQLGLDALEQNIGALLKAYPMVKEKLGSARADDRRATARFLKRMTSLGRFRDQAILRDLQEQAAREHDPETKRHISETVERLNKDLKR